MESAPSSQELVAKHISHLTSRSGVQRRESLSFLTTASTSSVHSGLIPALLPLFLDIDGDVRKQVIRLLFALPASESESYAEKMVLYLQAGMTHISPGVVDTSMDTLIWAIDGFGRELVSRPGGWVKMLKYFIAMLGWTEFQEPSTSAGWSSYKGPSSTKASEKAAAAKKIRVLAAFLHAGLSEPTPVEPSVVWPFPLHMTHAHMIPKRSHAFRGLNLFGKPWNEEDAMYEDTDERKAMFVKYAKTGMEKGLEAVKKEGGDIGRQATAALNIISEKMAGYEPPPHIMEEDEVPWIGW